VATVHWSGVFNLLKFDHTPKKKKKKKKKKKSKCISVTTYIHCSGVATVPAL